MSDTTGQPREPIQNPEPPKSPPPPDMPHINLIRLGLAILFAAAGASSGYFLGQIIGLSNTPIVAVLVPALLPLILFFANGTLIKSEEGPMVPLFGTLVFVGTLFGAAIFGVQDGLEQRRSNSAVVALDRDLRSAGLGTDDRLALLTSLLKSGVAFGNQTSQSVLYGAHDRLTSASPTDLTTGRELCGDDKLGSPPYGPEKLVAMTQAGGKWQTAAMLLESVRGMKNEDLSKSADRQVKALICGD